MPQTQKIDKTCVKIKTHQSSSTKFMENSRAICIVKRSNLIGCKSNTILSMTNNRHYCFPINSHSALRCITNILQKCLTKFRMMKITMPILTNKKLIMCENGVNLFRRPSRLRWRLFKELTACSTMVRMGMRLHPFATIFPHNFVNFSFDCQFRSHLDRAADASAAFCRDFKCRRMFAACRKREVDRRDPKRSQHSQTIAS